MGSVHLRRTHLCEHRRRLEFHEALHHALRCGRRALVGDGMGLFFRWWVGGGVGCCGEIHWASMSSRPLFGEGGGSTVIFGASLPVGGLEGSAGVWPRRGVATASRETRRRSG